MRVKVAAINVFVGRGVAVAVGGSVLVEVGNITGSVLTEAHALMISASMRTEIDLNLMGIGMSLTAPQDTLPA
jgi:hypothetical protein